MAIDWREALANSSVAIVSMDHDFYGSTGEEVLTEAIRLRIKILMLTNGLHVRIPQPFADYRGTKHLVLDEDYGDEAERVLRAWGVAQGATAYDYEWEQR